MTYYYCTCDPKRRSLAELGKTPYRRVKVNREDICLDCGFYAIACRKDLDPDKQLRAYLMDEYKPLPEKRNYGGLSKQCQMKSRRYYERKSKKTKDDDLDT